MLDAAVIDELDRLTKSLEPELVEFRRSRHQFPELGHREYKTTAAVVERLTAAGLEPRVLSSGTGVVCDVLGSSGEPATIGFRGDIDALPVADLTHTPYHSVVPGVCHACGHDAHTTIALGTALVLREMARLGHLEVSARLIFQPAEEITPGGALDVIADHALDGLRHVFALHCDPKVEVGKVGMRTGPITAGADQIRVSMTGPGGHTARPHLSSDLVYALGAVTTQLPAVLSRRCDPRAGLSVVWGQTHAGTAPNAIPQSGFAEGTMRCLDAAVWESAHQIVPDVVRAIAAPYGVDVEVDMQTSVPPCVNSEVTTELFRAAAARVIGPRNVVSTDQSLGGEDFAWIAARIDSSLARLGVRGPQVADPGDLHRGTFDIDEAALLVGVRLFSGVALAGFDD